MPKSLPRPEGKLIEWKNLSEDQRLVVRRLGELVDSMSRDESPPTDKSGPVFLPSIDRSRTNRVVLIDGKRGSGKSSVLLGVLDTYSSHFRFGVRESREGYDEFLTSEAGAVPVGLVDLNPLPGVENLLLQLLAPLGAVVRSLTARGSEAPAHILDAPNEGSLERMWADLQQIVARAWSVSARRSGQDEGEVAAAAFDAIEVAEEQLQLGSAFRNFMDALAIAFQQQYRGRRPLFVIAIDDADMSAKLSSELVSCIRIFWHARLVYVLTGDYELLRERIRARLSPVPEALAQIAQLILATAQVPRLRMMPDRESLLAEDILLKTIPRTHRLQLPLLEPEERFLFPQELRPALQRTRFDIREERMGNSLWDLLHAQTRPAGGYFLPDRMRGLVDFQLQLAQSADPYLFVVSRCREAALDLSISDEARSALARVANSVASLQKGLNPAVSWGPGVRLVQERSEDESRTSNLYSLDDCVLQFETKPLPESVAVPFFVLIELTARGARGNSTGVPVRFDPGVGLAQTMIRIAGQNLSCRWPTPNWRAPLDLQSFAARWDFLLGFGWQTEGMEESLRAFLDAALLVCERGSTAEQGELPSWQDLATRVVRLLNEDFDDRLPPLYLDWVRANALLFVSPELCPNPTATAIEYFFVLRSKIADWMGMTTAARRERWRWYAASAGAAPEMAERIRDATPLHPWWRDVEPEGPSGSEKERTVDALRERLGAAHLSFAKERFGQERLALNSYLTNSRRQLLLGADLEQLQRAVRAVDTVAAGSRWSISAPHAIVALWRELAAGGEKRDSRSWITTRDGGGIVMDRIAHSLALQWVESLSGRSRKRASGVRVPRSEFVSVFPAGQTTRRFTDRLTAGAEAVLRIAWDFDQDSLGEWPDTENRPIVGWKAYQFNLNRMALWPWPLPNWPQAWPWERYSDSWNHLLDYENDLQRTTSSVVPADSYVLALLKETMSWPNFMGSVTPDAQLEATSELVEFAKSAERYRSNVRSPQSKLYHHWLQRLILFATPEAGLDPLVSEGYIHYLRERSEQLPDAMGDCNRLRRAFHASVRGEDGLDLGLAGVDRLNSAHPWVTAFGQYNPRQG